MRHEQPNGAVYHIIFIFHPTWGMIPTMSDLLRGLQSQTISGFDLTIFFGEDEKAHTMSRTILGCCEATMLGPYAVMGIYLTFLEGAHS